MSIIELKVLDERMAAQLPAYATPGSAGRPPRRWPRPGWRR